MPLYCIKKLSVLLWGVFLKHDGNFYCLNCLHSFKTKSKLKSYRKECENKDFLNVVMASEDTKILGFTQYLKSDKTPFIIHADLKSLIEKIDGCKYNPIKSSTTKVSEHIPSCFSIPTITEK